MEAPRRWNADQLLGTRLGSCDIERCLGIGGMGAVYLARQERPRRKVAVKVLHPALASDAESWPLFLARFRREADATAALDHTNIIPIYEFGEQQGVAYLVMPYLPDGSLADLLARAGRLALATAVNCVAQAAAALDEAHGHGIIHRDVKPSNLLLHHDGRLLLADFGLAHPASALEASTVAGGPAGTHDVSDATLTQAGRVMGTPQYMAPEQILGQPVGPAADVYALGIVAYTLLAGQPPFDGGTTTSILKRQLTDPPPPLRPARADVPPRLEEAIFWALAKRPADRPVSAGTLAGAMRQAFQHVPHGSAQAYLPVHLYTQVQPPPSAPSSDAPTVYDPGLAAAMVEAGYGEPPPWPGMPANAARASGARRSAGCLSTVGVAVASACATILLVCVALAALAAHANHSTGQSTTDTALTRTPTLRPTPSPTPTPRPTPTPTPVVNWLSVSPAGVSLGCDPATNKAAHVILRNAGAGSTWWSASSSVWWAVAIDPVLSELPAGNSVTVTITNTTPAWTGAGQRGTITFKPYNSQAGASAMLDFTTQGC